jgi:hypothetical protein
MKRFLSAILLVSASVTLSSSVAQTPEAQQQQQVLQLIKDVRLQQAMIADNQTKIEVKLVEITENVRVARIFAERNK